MELLIFAESLEFYTVGNMLKMNRNFCDLLVALALMLAALAGRVRLVHR